MKTFVIFKCFFLQRCLLVCKEFVKLIPYCKSHTTSLFHQSNIHLLRPLVRQICQKIFDFRLIQLQINKGNKKQTTKKKQKNKKKTKQSFSFALQVNLSQEKDCIFFRLALVGCKKTISKLLSSCNDRALKRDMTFYVLKFHSLTLLVYIQFL